MMTFRQGGDRPFDGTMIGNNRTLYPSNDKITFYIDDPKQAQAIKDFATFMKTQWEKIGERRPSLEKYDFYFQIVNRKSTHRKDGLTMPCAKLVYFEKSE